MKTRNVITITYNYDNMPTQFNTSSFSYDYSNQRVKKVYDSTTTLYFGNLVECINGICSKYIFAGDKRIVYKKSSTELYYYHTDHLGSSSVMTDRGTIGCPLRRPYVVPSGSFTTLSKEKLSEIRRAICFSLNL